jgi:hypothetical protein
MKSRTVHATLFKTGLAAANPGLINGPGGRSTSPNGLRNAVYKALSKVPIKERVEWYKRLIGELQKAGINVGSRLFLLGIPATIPEELSPNDLGKLIRSVYLNEPKAMEAISETLSQILDTNGENKPDKQSVSSTEKKRK